MRQRGRTRKHRASVRIFSWLLVLALLLGMVPGSVTTARAAGVPEKLVSSLAGIYDGDEERAKQELETLYDAGLLDADGNLVKLDIREDGESAELSEVAQRIADGKTVGELTVNGNAATSEKLMQLQQVNSMLEVIRLIDKDVEITDEHIANLESLIGGIADGSIDLSDVISRGELRINAKGSKRLLGAGGSNNLSASDTGMGNVDATEGSYTAPYISGSTYEASHSFTLIDPENTTWYTDSVFVDGGVVTLSCAETATLNSTVTVTATLDKAQPFPVSFDWAAVSDVIKLTGEATGTVTWDAGDTQLKKTFSVKLGGRNGYWKGSQCLVINAGNIKNAAFEGEKTAWSQTLQITANDADAVSDGYPQLEKTADLALSKLQRGLAGERPKCDAWYYKKTKDVFPSSGNFKATYEVLNARDYTTTTLYLMSGDHTVSLTDYTTADAQFQQAPYVKMNAKASLTFRQSNLGSTSLGSLVVNGEVWVGIKLTDLYSDTAIPHVDSIKVSIPQIVTHDEVESVSVPAGTYYTGEVVPVTVTLKEYAVATADTKLTVNGVACPMLNKADTEAKTFTFGYTVKETDSGALKVTALSDTFKNVDGVKVSFDKAFPTTDIGTADKVVLSSDIKGAGLDWENVKYGMDDGKPGEQTLTVVIPFKSGADKTWVTNEAVEINPAVSMPIPGYENAVAGAYLGSAYCSTDGGETRYPVYVIGETADALAVRFAPTLNVTPDLRRDTLSLFLDPIVGTDTAYLGEWKDKKTDAKGFACFDAAENSASTRRGASYTYYVKASVLFDKTETIDRPNYNEANIMKDSEGKPLGFYKEGNGYVAVQGEDASRQHDVELVANEALYNAVTRGIRGEDPNTLILSYQISNRADFTFADMKNFTWRTSDKEVATVVKDEETGAGQIALTGKAGTVTITLTVGNGSDSNQYDLSVTFTVLEGKTPFLNIPIFSRERTTLTDTDTQVLYTSNVTERNAAVGRDTTFTAKLYHVRVIDETPSGDPVWTEDFTSTAGNTLTHITVPGDQLPEAGIYAVVVSTKYEGGEVDGMMTDAADLSATAYLNVRQAPLKVMLNKLESYSASYDELPKIGYTIKPAGTEAIVEYTIQKSGEAVGERKPATDGKIPFTAGKPENLKDAYTITVYARSKDAEETDPWSVDSMVLRVYNMDILELIVKDVAGGEIGGSTSGTGDSANNKTVTMDNHDKLQKYGITGGSYQLTVDDLNALRTDMSLQKIISANYGTGVWGLLSDKMQWSSSDSDLVSINYKQGGFYSDIRNYSYTSYGPATDFLLVGKDKTEGVTITATHAGTGKKARVTVAANTLKDQLYVFQFNPQVETDVVYTNGKGKKRELKSNEKGELAVYEPEGIKSAVMAMSKKEDQTYVGTIFRNELQSGERDIAALKLYPCNNLRLRSISNLTLNFRNPDGSAYNGEVTLRAGVYKNGVYCPAAKSFLASDPGTKYGAQDDISATVSNGKLTLGFNPTEFKNDPDNAEETGAYAADKVTYVVEYRVPGYQTSYALVNVYTDVEGEQKPMDSVIRLRAVKDSAGVPQIVRQTIQQYSDGKPVSYTRDVTDYTENIGISRKFNKVVLTTDFVLPNSLVSVDEDGHTTISGEFALYTVDGKKLTGQTDYGSGEAAQIIKLSDLEGSKLFVFPFSSSPIGRHVYTMTDDDLKKDGITDEGEDPVTSSRIKAMFVQGGMAVTNTTLPFGISNLSHQQDLTDSDAGAQGAAADIKDVLKSNMSVGEIFKEINVNDMLKKGFTFLGGLSAGGDVPLSLMILPTEDPGIFRIVAFVGYNQAKNKEDTDGLQLEYDSDTMYEDFNSLLEENKDDDDDDDDDDSGKGSYDVSFSGTIILEAGYDFAGKKWSIDFRGGSVGLGFRAKYEWSQNFMCGPIPANISFETGANIELEVSFASKSSVKLMLVDATVGVYIEAFAGLGFDASIAKLKLGIYGKIGADANFLLLSDFKKKPTGTKLDINGEIGIRLEVKILFINYKKTFASTGFNWTKKWNQYDSIREQWNSTGYAEVNGVTQSGRAYSMRLLANGKALVAIEGGNEIESRDYMELAERAWMGGTSSGRRLMKAAGQMANALTNVQTNAYPYSNPVLTDDGSMFLYISDNDNAEELQSVVSYAVKSGNGYENKGAVDTGEGSILADSDVVASGSGKNIFAAWVKQNESPDKEMSAKATYDDLGMMMNATDIYAGSYDGIEWKTERLTDNKIADMAPTVASSGNRAIVAWRSLSAAKMPEEGGSQDISAMFNAENNVNYRIWNGSSWTEAQAAYNGATGTVNAIDSAMLSDGTALLTYTVRTGEDVTDTETFYTVIGKDGKVVTTGRLTNDSCTDTNAQVTAVGNQFVIGWYSEHGTGEKVADPQTGEEKDVVAHDIRLARINANGSVDADFPESIGGDAASTITSGFRFSAPANNTDLSKLSIVWPQTKDSESAKDAGKYELNAVRFYEEKTGADSVIGVTAQTDIAETAKNVTVDHFDTYTDESGTVYTLILGSDYSAIDGIDVFDEIDLSNLPVAVGNGDAEPSSKTLTILEQDPVANIKLGRGTFPETAIEVTADTNLHELVPGLNQPVQFTVKNVGASTVDSVDVSLGGLKKTVGNLALAPNQSTIITEAYPVPGDKVVDLDYTVTADNAAAVTGKLKLNRPDVGISGMKLLREEDGERTIQVTLGNASGIPLARSGKTVKVGLYTSADHSEKSRVGKILTISDENDLADIDDDIYGAVQTLDVQELIGNAKEIPDSGIRLYAHAWVENANGKAASELYSGNNDGTLAFKGLLTKNKGEKLTIDTALEVKTDDQSKVTGYTAHVDFRNNSMQEQTRNIPVAVLFDKDGKMIANKKLQDEDLVLEKEQRCKLSADFTAEELGGKTPVRVDIRYLYKVNFDLNGGTGEFPMIRTDWSGHLAIPEDTPKPPENESPLFFRGWYTSAADGERITDGTVFTEDSTVYAQYTRHEHVFEYTNADNGDTVTVKCVSTVEDDCPLEAQDRTVTLTIVKPERAGQEAGNPNATLSGDMDVLGTPEIRYYRANADGTDKTGEALSQVPIGVGKYWAEFTLGEGENTATGHVVYDFIVEDSTNRTTAAFPNFKKVENKNDLKSSRNIKACTHAEALAWVYAHPEMIGNKNKIVFSTNGSEFFYVDTERPDNLYDVNYNYHQWGQNTKDDVYVVDSGSSNLMTNSGYTKVTDADALTAALDAMDDTTEQDALTWITANAAKLKGENGANYIVFAKNNNNYRVYRLSNTDETVVDEYEDFDPYEEENHTVTVSMRGEKVGYENRSASNLASMLAGGAIIYVSNAPTLCSTHTVNYNLNGGTGTTPEGGTIYHQVKLTLPGDDSFSKPNLVFDGWNTKADGTGDAYAAGDAYTVTQNTTLYAQWKHGHQWSMGYNEENHTFTQTCSVPGCPLGGRQTLRVEAADKMYDGENVQVYTCTDGWTAENGFEMPTVTYYSGGSQVSEAKNVGTYTATVSLYDKKINLGEFHVTPRPIAIIANDQEKHEGEEDPDFTVSYDKVSDNWRFENDATYPWKIITEGDRVYVKSGNGGVHNSTSTLTLKVTLAEAGTLSFDYTSQGEGNDDNPFDVSRFYVDDAQKFQYGGDHFDWQSYSCDLAAGPHTLKWSYSKDGGSNRPGDCFTMDNFAIRSDGAVTQEEAEGDSDVELNRAVNKYEGGIVEGETLNYTVNREEGDGEGTYAIRLIPGVNPNYDVKTKNGTLTILEAQGNPQTITAEDVTATYGDTDAKVSASVTEPAAGGGAISYAVKEGSEDYISVDASTGVLTIKKVPADGKAYVTVRAAKTDTLAPASKDVTVTINRKAMTVIANDKTVGIGGRPSGITVTDPADGYTVKYGTEEGTYDLDEIPTRSDAGTLAVYYQVTADNYVTRTGSVTLTFVEHTHEMSYVVGTGKNASTITATCAKDDCYLEDEEQKHTAMLTIAAPEGEIVYDGEPHAAVITDENGIQGDAKVLYAAKDADGTYGDPSETVPVNAGTYKASITLGEGGKAVTATVEYTIAKGDPTAEAPAGLTASYGQTLADVSLSSKNPEGNTPGEWAWVDNTTNVGTVGEHTFKASFTPKDTANYNVKNGVDVTVTVNKAANPAKVMGAVSVRKGGKTFDLAKCVALNGATGDVTYAISGGSSGCALEGSILTSGSDTGTVAVSVAVAADANYDALAVQTITVTIADKNTQIITAEDVTVTYGDTDKSVNATTDVEDAGITISYAVKEGSKDYIEIAPDGKLTIKKVPADGKAYVTVTASGSDDYFEATKEVTVQINKADAVAAKVTGNSGTYDGTDRPLVTVDDSAQVGGTMWYAVSTDADKEPAEDEKNWKTAIPTAADAGTYYVWYKVIGDENHSDFTADQAVLVEIKADTAAPTGEISIDTNKWASFLNTITFGFFFKETKEVKITASDDLSGVGKIEYYIADAALSQAQAEAVTDWKTYDSAFNLNPENKYVVYARITDKAGNITYLSSDGLVFVNLPVGYVTDIDTDSAKLNMKLSDSVRTEIKAAGFEYKKKADADTAWTKVEAGSVAETITKEIASLTAGTDYVFRPYVTYTNDSTDTGAEQNFTTGTKPAVTGSIDVKVKNDTDEKKDVVVTIEEGNNVLASQEYNGIEKNAEVTTGKFKELPDGTYNIVIKSKDGEFVETKMITIASGAEETISFTISKGEMKTDVEVEADTPKVAVDGLSKEELVESGTITSEEKKDVEDGKISLEVTLKAEKQEQGKVKTETVSAIQQVMAESSTKLVVDMFLDLSLFKTVTQLTGDQAGKTDETDIGSTNTKVLEIAVPYDTTIKGLMVYRYHGSAASALKKLSSAPAKGTYEDGSFYLSDKYIHIFASGFSTYAIAKEEESSSGGGGGTTPVTPGKTTPSKPAAPTLDSKTDTSITVKTVAGQEYSRDGGKTWQISGTFTGLTPETEYSIVTKITATGTANESPVSDALKVTTDKKADPSTPTDKPGGTPGSTTTPTDKPGETPGSTTTPTDKPGETPGSTTPTNTPDGTTTPTASTDKVTSAEKAKAKIKLNAGLTVSQTGKKVTVKWGKVNGADRYVVYAAYCNSGKCKKVGTLSGSKTSMTFAKLNGSKLNLKKNVKVYVVAYRKVNGKEMKLARSITAHIVGTKNTKYTNVKKIKLSKSKYTLKVNKTATIKAKIVLVDKKKKQLSDSHAPEFRYASSNTKVATVDKNGKITAVKKGTCYIYVYAKNGYAKKVKVTVK